MNDLLNQQCSAIEKGGFPLDKETVAKYLTQLDPRWTLNDDNKSISFNYKFENYYQTLAFVNVIAQIAHQQDHHPDISFSYNSCNVCYSTHSVGGLSINDFICAAKTNAAQNL